MRQSRQCIFFSLSQPPLKFKDEVVDVAAAAEDTAATVIIVDEYQESVTNESTLKPPIDRR